jgi:hypothetical protein
MEDSEAVRLDAWARSRNISRTEAVRRAVRLMLDDAAPSQGSGFGLWKQALPGSVQLDSLELQRQLREEWPE